jgi:Dyp-type peroxidase family
MPEPQSAAAAATAIGPMDHGDQALEAQVQTGLNLFLRLRSPAEMPLLLKAIAGHMEQVHEALEGLHYVHFARFLPTPDFSTLIVVTEFDGDLKSYIMDFVAVMGNIFTTILEFVQDAPRLPVNQYPQDFWAFVQAHNMAQVQPWSAYKQSTVIELKGVNRPLPKAVPDAAAQPLDLADIQGNILRGYRVHHARHFALAVSSAQGGQAFLAALVNGDEAHSPQVSTAAAHTQRPEYFLNVGLTHAGLAALGVATGTLALFPPAFVQGPAARAEALGDVGEAAPAHWEVGGPGQTAHLVLSLYTDEHLSHRLDAHTARLRALFAQHGLQETWCHDATALPGGAVHFGYKDGIAQPRIAGTPGRQYADLQPASAPGEFLLGKGYVNQYLGNFAGDLPAALADNGTYAALRLLKQDTAAFENLIEQAAVQSNMDKELIAAKMMGRWRDGSPLTLAPEAPNPRMGREQLNRFDYAPNTERPAYFDDNKGLRCPVGSHTRRLNPRGALVTGKPHSRRIVRRGMPYGPAFDPAHPNDGIERGLLGLFICGDLEMQFEFLVSIWCNDDIATAGLRGTRDPILGAHPAHGGRFDILTEDLRNPVRITVPRLVQTRGSLYLFIPGINALKALAGRAAG